MTQPSKHIDQITAYFREELGDNLPRFKNHAMRVYYLCNMMHSGELKAEDKEDLALASAFHGLSDWVKDENYTKDHWVLVIEYLASNDLLDRADSIRSLTVQLKKNITVKSSGSGLRELFRRAYWIDITRGRQSFGIPLTAYHRLLKKFPSRGFHWLNLIRTNDLSSTDARIQISTLR